MSPQEFIPPIDIPLLLHLPIVHFAIAFLVVVILLEVVNLIFQKRALSVFSLLVIVLFAVAMSLAYLTVGVDGKEIVMAVNDAGKVALSEYKTFGVYLGTIALALIVVKMLFMTMSNILTRFFFVFLLFCILVLSGIQIKNGTLLKQNFGVDSKSENIEKEKSKLQNSYSELETKYKKLMAEVTENNATAQELKSLQEKYDALVKSSEESAKKEFVDNSKSEVEELSIKEQEKTTQTPFDSKTEEATTTEPTVEKETEEVDEHIKEESSSTVSLDIPSDKKLDN